MTHKIRLSMVGGGQGAFIGRPAGLLRPVRLATFAWFRSNMLRIGWQNPLKTRGKSRSHGCSGLGVTAAKWTRVPPGHPEGYLEGFANIYTDAAKLIRGDAIVTQLPDIHDGLLGMWFITACIASNRSNGARTPIDGRV